MTARNLMIKERPARRKITGSVISNADAVAHTASRWNCRHRLDGSDIEAYVMATGNLEIIAQTRVAEGIDARANAERIIRAVNAYEKTQPLIADLVAALKLCLTCEGLSWEAEQEAELVIARTMKRT